MNTANSPNGVTPEERMAKYRECRRLLNERNSLSWWRWRRFNAINREIRALLASLEDDS